MLILVEEGRVIVVGLVDVSRAPVDKDRVSAAERLGEVLVESEASVMETDSSEDWGGSSSLSEEILGISIEAGSTSLVFSLLL